MNDNTQATQADFPTKSALSYQQFLQAKFSVAKRFGFEIDRDCIDDALFDHQRDAVKWAISLGRGLIAMSFGLGKTRIQIEIAKQVIKRTERPFLIVCPLGVKHQFQSEDGPIMGTDWQYVRNDAEVDAATSPYLITNYERVRDGSINPTLHNFGGCSLDEGSVIRSLGSKTYDVFMDAFSNVPFRYVATATPDPNDYKELIYYAQYLDIIDSGFSLTEWFQRDPQRAGHLTLYPHRAREFWLWVSTWALFLYTPSDIGYSDDGYSLPSLNIHYHRVAVDYSRAWKQMDDRGQFRLIPDAAAGVSEASEEKRETIPARIAKTIEIINDNPGRHWLLWHNREDERAAIEKAIPEALTVYGSQKLDVREQRILGFAHGEIPILATKPEIAGSGCNFQYHCYSNIFVGVDYKFEDFIQAIHRTYRFQQGHEVDIHIVFAESEDAVVDVLKRKWKQYDDQVKRMREIVKRYGLSHEAVKRDLARSIGVERVEHKHELFTAVNNDCVAELRNMPDNSIGLIHTSIPFGDHYQYVQMVEDFGYNRGDSQFWVQMDYLIPELLRVLKPGRVAAIHVKDRQLYGHQTESGIMETAPFSDECVMAFRAHGFTYQGRRTIVTDVVRENAGTYRLGWTEMTKDASKMSSGLPEYLLLFRKPPTSTETSRADEPVTKSKDDYSRGRWQIDAHSLWRSNGNRPLTPEEYASMFPAQSGAIFAEEQLNQPYDYGRHVAICEEVDRREHLPKKYMQFPPKVTQDESDMVWDDVIFMRSLNGEQARRRLENHVCPLPFDIVQRAIRLYSNPDDVVLDPFAGLFTVIYCALELGRRGYGVELNPQYYQQGLKYCREMVEKITTPTLFDLINAQQADAAD